MGFHLIPNFSINVHERVDIFATNVSRHRKTLQMGKNNWMSFCDKSSAPTIAAVDLIFLPVVL